MRDVVDDGFMEACGCRHGLFDGANECVAVVVLHSGLPFSSVVRKESAERKPWQYAASAHFWWLTVICCRRFKLVMCWMQRERRGYCGARQICVNGLRLQRPSMSGVSDDGMRRLGGAVTGVRDDARCNMVDVVRKMHEMEDDSMVAGEFAAAASEVQVR
ncbi:hypothetical protein DEO72_LG8g2385 [Vigna unguiculata]|uniref:Uncharacterized protein n=1 Tax=Vigna unguiculata TaxID=3917 RepID=A0A4D6MW73_VIGUN|nr:hypothetical protein DEO72_LG8g2385 [Vigna unguiculata]